MDTVSERYAFTRCRLCLNESEQFLNIFEVNERHGFVVAETITDLLKLDVSKVDGYPQVICRECLDKLSAFNMLRKYCKVDILPGFILFMDQCQIAKTTFEYAIENNELSSGSQHSPLSMDHSPFCLKLEDLGMEEEFQPPKCQVGDLLEAVSSILRSIKCEEADLVLENRDAADSNTTHSQVEINDGKKTIDGASEVHPQSSDVCSGSQVVTRLRLKKMEDSMKMGECCDDRTKEKCFPGEKKTAKVYKADVRAEKPVESKKQIGLGNSESLKKYRIANMRKNLFECNICGKKFHTKQSIGNHMRLHDAWHKCKECGQKFKLRRYLNEHTKLHMEKPFWCNQCDKKFRNRADLLKHQLIHSGLKQFCCNICGREFTHKRNLNVHLVIHSGVKSIQCDECGMRFSHRFNLNIHKTVHSKKKPFKCKICSKRFSRLQLLKLHLKVHNGIRPKKCNECGMRFTQSGDLDKHMVVHTGERRFKCKCCGKKFAHNRNMIEHMKNHSRTERFECGVCGKTYAQAGNLRTHKRLSCNKMESAESDYKSKRKKISEKILKVQIIPKLHDM